MLVCCSYHKLPDNLRTKWRYALIFKKESAMNSRSRTCLCDADRYRAGPHRSIEVVSGEVPPVLQMNITSIGTERSFWDIFIRGTLEPGEADEEWIRQAILACLHQFFPSWSGNQAQDLMAYIFPRITWAQGNSRSMRLEIPGSDHQMILSLYIEGHAREDWSVRTAETLRPVDELLVARTESASERQMENPEIQPGELDDQAAFLRQFELTAINITREILDEAEQVVLSEQERYTGRRRGQARDAATQRAGVVQTAAHAGHRQRTLRQNEERQEQERTEAAERERVELARGVEEFLRLRRAGGTTGARQWQTTARYIESRERLERQYPILTDLSPSDLSQLYLDITEFQMESAATRTHFDRDDAIRRFSAPVSPGN